MIDVKVLRDGLGKQHDIRPQTLKTVTLRWMGLSSPKAMPTPDLLIVRDKIQATLLSPRFPSPWCPTFAREQQEAVFEQLSLSLLCQGDSPDKRAAAAFPDPVRKPECYKLTPRPLAQDAAGKAIL